MESIDFEKFEARKKDHIQLSLKEENQALGLSQFDSICLEHEALPDLNFDDVSIETHSIKKIKTPFLISSMTAGHRDAISLNLMMAEVCQSRDWMMGVGSQRRELHSANLNEWKSLRKKAPRAVILSNLGISQLLISKLDDVQRLVDSIEAQGIFIHLNILQECLQKEGTPQFRGSLKVIEKLCKKSSVPVIIKETGCGFSQSTLKKLKNSGIHAVDVSGLGGTHWGRIEGKRNEEGSLKGLSSVTFKDWGISTVDALLNARGLDLDYEIWASGGIRSGLDAAKSLALGAKIVGFAKPALENALLGEKKLDIWMQQMEFELKTALICTGSKNIKALKRVSIQRK